MRRIDSYRVISGTYRNMAAYVKALLPEGWQPIGGIAWIGDDEDTGETYLAQAMVRYDMEGEDHEES